MLQTNVAHAIFEVKAGYGTLASKVDMSSFYSGPSSNLPGAVPTAGLTLDARVVIPFVGLGVGLRTENQKISYDSSVLGISNSFTRTSLVLNYRLIDTLVHFGPIVTIGMSHGNELKLTGGGQTLANVSSSSVTSNSVGLELSAGILGITAGAELGYMNMKYKGATDSLHTGTSLDLDMSGNYMKLLVGFGI